MPDLSHLPAARAHTIAMVLPQFHPIPENDEWWGPGFTEWTNVAKARPLYPGHYQPHLPGELGFYDLRLEETRAAQGALARAHGVHAFCFWHYWFAGRRMLDRVVNEVLESGVPDHPFCLGWANESWGGVWVGAPRKTLIEQTYPGDHDHRRHFDAVLPMFEDPRYLRIDDRPVFYVYRPFDIPDLGGFVDLWRTLASEAGLPGLYLIGQSAWGAKWRASHTGFDAEAHFNLVPQRARAAAQPRTALDQQVLRVTRRLGRIPEVMRYDRWSEFFPDVPEDVLATETVFPSVIPNWDNTPRRGAGGTVLHGSTPAAFEQQLDKAVRMVEHRQPHERVVFIRSWNEWAEGNHLEPDREFGRGYLEAVRRTVRPQT